MLRIDSSHHIIAQDRPAPVSERWNTLLGHQRHVHNATARRSSAHDHKMSHLLIGSRGVLISSSSPYRCRSTVEDLCNRRREDLVPLQHRTRGMVVGYVTLPTTKNLLGSRRACRVPPNLFSREHQDIHCLLTGSVSGRACSTCTPTPHARLDVLRIWASPGTVAPPTRGGRTIAIWVG